MLITDWEDRWANHTDAQLRQYIISPGEEQQRRHQSYIQPVLEHINPRTVLDIGGGTGEFGKQLSLSIDIEYTVLDNERMREYLWEDAKFIPMGNVIGQYDLVVNTNSFGETTIEIVTNYIRQIEAAKCKYFYTVNRNIRQVSFHEYPLENWKPFIDRSWPMNIHFHEFLGELMLC